MRNIFKRLDRLEVAAEKVKSMNSPPHTLRRVDMNRQPIVTQCASPGLSTTIQSASRPTMIDGTRPAATTIAAQIGCFDFES
jgi:hypothetical protein